jgi:hypothetical protein
VRLSSKPTTVFLRSDGSVKKVQSYALDMESLQELIKDELLS